MQKRSGPVTVLTLLLATFLAAALLFWTIDRRSAGALAALQGLAESLEALEAADARTRQNLSLGQELMAADVIFSDGRNLLDGMAGRLRDLRHAERGASSAALATDARARWATLALLALTWVGAAGAFWRARPGSAAVPEM